MASPTNLTLSDVFTPATQPQWLTTLLGAMGTLNLPATAWQSGGVARTIVSLQSFALSSQDGLISIAAQGGFLDFAASGSVTYTTTAGTTVTVPVTPDPSALTGAALAAWLPGWLDILADGSYNVQRISATYAAQNLALTNATGGSQGPFAAGTYHVANPATGATYSNTAALTIAAASIAGTVVTAASNATPIAITTSTNHGLSTGQTVTVAGAVGNTAANGTFLITVTGATTFTLTGSSGNGAWTSGGTVNVCTVAPFAADAVGSAGSANPGTVTQTVTSLIGITCSNTAAFVGQNYETNTAVAARCRLKLQSLSPNGAAGAYAYFALTSSTLLAALATPLALVGGAITRAGVTFSAGNVTTTIANGTGAVTGAANVAIAGAANNGSGLIRLQVTSTAGMTGYAVVSGIVGMPNATGTWTLTVVDGTHIDLIGTTFAGFYGGGGVLGWGDVGLVDGIIQANCVPSGTTAITQSATALPVTIAATVYVPASQITAYTAAVSVALANYFASIPIGGAVADGGTNVLPYSAINGVLFAAGIVSGAASYVRGITGLLVNSGTVDLTLTSAQVAQISGTPAITVIGQ